MPTAYFGKPIKVIAKKTTPEEMTVHLEEAGGLEGVINFLKCADVLRGAPSELSWGSPVGTVGLLYLTPTCITRLGGTVTAADPKYPGVFQQP